MTVLWVENRSEQYHAEATAVARAIRGLDFVWIRSEHALSEWLAEESNEYPGAVVLDVMLPWVLPISKDSPPPPYENASKRFTAGFRCYKEIRKKYPLLPVAFNSAISPDDHEIREQLEALRPHRPVYIEKTESMAPIINFLRDCLSAQGWNQSKII